MLRLKLPTDPHWARLVEQNIEAAMIDHAFCEQKAASSAISLIVNYPEYSDLVRVMADLAQEEMHHFSRVHELILKRGGVLGQERKDSYVNELLKFVRKGTDRKTLLLDRLLFAAMIEARSCERFRVLSTTVQDAELAAFYHELMASEALHYTTFLKLARQYFPADVVEARWQAFLEYEAQVIERYGISEEIHG